MILKLCAGCFRTFSPLDVSNGRCLSCRRSKERARGTRTGRGYDNDWLRLSADAIRQHPYSSNCGGTEDLTADHIVPKAAGGRNVLGNVEVLCRRCNSGKRDRGMGAGLGTQTLPAEPRRRLSRKKLAAGDEQPPDPLVA